VERGIKANDPWRRMSAIAADWTTPAISDDPCMSARTKLRAAGRVSPTTDVQMEVIASSTAICPEILPKSYIRHLRYIALFSTVETRY